MTVSKARAKKIAQRIQEDLAVILQQEAEDPRLSLVAVTDVEVDRELAYATVYVSAVDMSDRQGEILEALLGARGFLRSKLASQIDLRVFPQLRFRWDETPARAARIDELLAEIDSEDKAGGDEGS